MKVLVVCQYYKPEPFRISDICEELVKRGNEVTVITGTPNYPMGKIYSGYGFGRKKNEAIDGVSVHRCFTIGRRSGLIFRFLNYYSYSLSASAYCEGLNGKYDAVFVNQLSPVMMAAAAIKYGKKHNVPVILYCLDLWPESLTAGGINKGSFIYNYFHKVSKKIYKSVDRLLITSKSFEKYFNDEFGIKCCEYLPQYAEELFTPESCVKKNNDTIDLMFAGNIGSAQSVDTIIEAAKLTVDIKNLKWHIVGDGSECERLKKSAENIDSVIFHGRKPLDEMPEFYSMADAMLVTMKSDPVLSMTLPGKVQTYMAAGKAVIGAIDGETADVIKHADCGLCCRAEDPKALSDIVRFFAENNERAVMEKNSRLYYEKNFSKKSFIDKLEGILNSSAMR